MLSTKVVFPYAMVNPSRGKKSNERLEEPSGLVRLEIMVDKERRQLRSITMMDVRLIQLSDSWASIN